MAVRGLGRLLLSLSLLAGCEGSLSQESPPRLVRVADGPVTLVGGGFATCSNQEKPREPRPDRWCAFARPNPATGTTELWTLRLSAALEGKAPCDGQSPHCLRLTANLWTGQPVFAPSHPFVHGFDGDTLVFYTDSVTGNTDQPFQGPVSAWRVGGAQRVLTGAEGVYCIGQPRSDSIICIDAQTGSGADMEFDLRVGSLGAAAPGILPLIERIRPYDSNGDLMWRVALSPDGKYLAYSTRAEEIKVERLKALEVTSAGVTAPTEIIRDISDWQFLPGSEKVVFLRGYNYSENGDASGILTIADFPSGANPTELFPRVGRYWLVGDPVTPQGLGFFQDLRDFHGNFHIIPDTRRPQEVMAVAPRVEDILVSPDLAYSVFHAEDGDTLSTVLLDNASSTRCALGAKPEQLAFSVSFVDTPRRVLWMEDSDIEPVADEGWVADPQDCSDKRRFSANLLHYETTRAGVVYGEKEGLSFDVMTLRYQQFQDGQLGPEGGVEIARGVDPIFSLIDRKYILFQVIAGPPEALGLYLYGPLP